MKDLLYALAGLAALLLLLWVLLQPATIAPTGYAQWETQKTNFTEEDLHGQIDSDA